MGSVAVELHSRIQRSIVAIVPDHYEREHLKVKVSLGRGRGSVMGLRPRRWKERHSACEHHVIYLHERTRNYLPSI